MNITFQPFTEEYISLVQAFNRRMLAGGLDPLLAFPENPELDYPKRPGAAIWQQAFLALDEGQVRGAYYFTNERYAVNGSVSWIAHYRHPISEVLINKAYRGLGSVLLQDAKTRQPDLFCSGYGGIGSPVSRMLRADGWSEVSTPFWFQVIRPAVFLRNIAALRTSPARRVALDLAAVSGLGALAIRSIHGIKGLRSQRANVSSEVVAEFGPWADELWEANLRQHMLAFVRDSAGLNLHYPPDNSRFQRIAVVSGSRRVGWAVTLDKQMSGNSYFGDMRVGTIVDCLAAPGYEGTVVRMATERLREAGVDIVVSNQSAASWCDAFSRAGFLSGPSNYPLAVSPALAQKLDPFAANRPRYHIVRGDGAGASRL